MENSEQRDNRQKTALITGGRSGIGLELTKSLLQKNWRVISLDRSAFAKEDQVIQKAFHNGSLTQHLADLSDFAQLKRVLNLVTAKESYLDILFNNAGSMTGHLMFSKQGRELDFEVNTVVPFIIVSELKPLLLKGNLKTIINTSSNAALQAKTFTIEQLEKPTSFTKLFGSYASSKLAISLWTLAIAPELGRENILIRSVDPGPTKTSLSKSAGMPWFLLLIRPFIFSHPGKAANKIQDAAFGKYKNGSGIFLINGKKVELKFRDKMDELLNKLKSIYLSEFKIIQ